MTEETDHISVLRKAFAEKDRDVALRLCPVLSVEEKKELFPEFLHIARCAHSPFDPAWTLILSLPRDWLLANIESAALPILNEEDETDYWMFLQLFAKIDHDLALGLAAKAAGHADASIRELGVEWQVRLQSTTSNGKQVSTS